jgi:hypothetical protein
MKDLPESKNIYLVGIVPNREDIEEFLLTDDYEDLPEYLATTVIKTEQSYINGSCIGFSEYEALKEYGLLDYAKTNFIKVISPLIKEEDVT